MRTESAWSVLSYDTMLTGRLPFEARLHTYNRDFDSRSITRHIRGELTLVSGPTFGFANFMDAHGPYTPFRGMDADLYDGPRSFTSSKLTGRNQSRVRS